jgi:hypothetical protein
MAQTQTAGKSNARSEAAKKSAATRAANKAATAGQVVGPKGRKLADAPVSNDVPAEQRQGERRQQQDNVRAQFAPQQLAAPAAHAPELQAGNPEQDVEAAKQKAFEEAVKALATTMGVQVPAQLTAPQPAQRAQRADKQQQNNITRPQAGTKTGLVWDVADEITHKKGDAAAIAEVRADQRLRQHNEHTLKTQYARWRQYHGIKGQITAAPKGQAAPEVQTEDYQGPDRREHDDAPAA